MNTDTSNTFIPNVRYCPCSRSTGWVKLRYRPRPVKLCQIMDCRTDIVEEE